MNVFTRPISEYKRDINILKHCHEDNAFYLHKETGRPYDECLAWVRKATGPNGQFSIKDPDVLTLCRDKGEDKVKRVMTLSTYIKDVIEKEYIISPSMTVYVSTKEKESLSARYIAGNIALRATAKKEMFQAGLAGNKLLEDLKNIEQTSRKLNNNAMSGAQASFSTPLYNKSAHSSLTSTCRTETSYGNANNEKFIAGNRHYWCPDVTLSSIITICRMTDLANLKSVMEKYSIHYPTTDEAMACVTYSTKFYWGTTRADAHSLEAVRSLLDKLTPIERAAFVYVGDLYHLHIHNPKLVIDFLVKLSTKVCGALPDNADEIMSRMDGDLVAYVSSLCYQELIGTDIKAVKANNLEHYGNIVCTTRNILETTEAYSDLIKTLWCSDNMPGSVANVPAIIRRTAVVSDTDSTIFTAQHWTHTVTGSYSFTDLSKGVSATITYLASQLIAHVLAQMSINIGVDPKHVSKLAMKNEYNFPVFSLTARAKHYFAYQGSREGNVYKKYKMEVKGVELRSSNIPAHVMDTLKNLMGFIMDEIIAHGNLSIIDVYDEIALLELSIINSVNSGKYDYMPTGQIKAAAQYKNPMSSNFMYYGLWTDVFGDKYGHTAEPSYSTVKISVNADSPTRFKAWVAGFKDQEIAKKMLAWSERTGKKYMTQMLVPENVVSAVGVPPEIISGIDTRKLVFGIVSGFYLVLESLGIYMKDDNTTRLVSDFHTPTRSISRFVKAEE